MVNKKKPIKHTSNIELYAEELVERYLDELYDMIEHELCIDDSKDQGSVKRFCFHLFEEAYENVKKGKASPEEVKFLTDMVIEASSAYNYKIKTENDEYPF